jgi:hypothetical protein
MKSEHGGLATWIQLNFVVGYTEHTHKLYSILVCVTVIHTIVFVSTQWYVTQMCAFGVSCCLTPRRTLGVVLVLVL